MSQSEYNEQAMDFLRKTGTKVLVSYLRTGSHFNEEDVQRDIYKVVLIRGERFFEFEFGQSVACSETGEEPSAYDVLACLEKHEVGTLEEFCGNYGYDEDSRKAEKTYRAVVKEWENVQRLWSEEELEDLRKIE